jgi:mannose-6-phosphate isomerase-like protein (cupin superfamily)
MQKELRPRTVFINPIYKDVATVISERDENGNESYYGLLEVYPGGGNPFHVHHSFEETFTAVKGTLGVAVKGKKMYLRPGESFTVPIKTPHHFFNDTQEKIVCHIRFSPPHFGFIKGIAIAYGLAADGKTTRTGMPKSLTHLAVIIKLTDTNPSGPVALLVPLFKWLAKRAERKGVLQQLLEKYYYES